jgi:rSAM/selenodomain-associated transferase 1
MTEQQAIIIFVREPVLGRVKTRLAAAIGAKKALKAYELLLQHTYHLVKNAGTPVYIYYADEVVENDLWQGGDFIKQQQRGSNLGSRMKHAFNDVFSIGHKKVVIIGSDCYELTTGIISEAFLQLDTTDSVIGPATDGGYYLLGLQKLIPAIFENIAWSTNSVKDETVKILEQNNYSFSLLQTLTDVDEEKDLPQVIKDQL